MKKRILFINDFVYGGGVEKVLNDIVLFMDRNKYEISVLTEFKDDFYRYFPSHVRYITFGEKKNKRNKKKSIFERVIRRIRKEIVIKSLNGRYDTVVAIKEGKPMKLAASILWAKKRIAWIHTDYAALHWTASCFASLDDELNCMKKFDTVVCVSNAVKENTIEVIGDSGNLTTKYNAVDIDDIITKSKEKIDLVEDKNVPLFLSVGRLRAQKGYPALIKVCHALKEKGLKFKLWIIGDSDDEKYKSSLYEQVRCRDLEDTVYFLGSKSNPYPYMKQADWFVCSSEWESFGIAIQESLVLGVPVITTNCQGATELLSNEYSIVVDDMKKMEETMSRIICNPEMTQRYRKGLKEKYRPVSAAERLSSIENLF